MANSGGGVFLPNEASTVTATWTFTSPVLTSPTITGATLTTSTLTAPTITTPTITTPTITAPSGSASTGLLITKSGVITELTGNGTYAITIAVPAGAFIHRIMVAAQALWTAGTSAAMIVGDTADPNGYFDAVDLKATDLLVGEVLDTISSSSWGGKEGAYLVAATGQRGPAATNFGTYYAAGSDIVFSVTKVGTGTAGRTAVSVTYSVGETIAQVVT